MSVCSPQQPVCVQPVTAAEHHMHQHCLVYRLLEHYHQVLVVYKVTCSLRLCCALRYCSLLDEHGELAYTPHGPCNDGLPCLSYRCMPCLFVRLNAVPLHVVLGVMPLAFSWISMAHLHAMLNVMFSSHAEAVWPCDRWQLSPTWHPCCLSW